MKIKFIPFLIALGISALIAYGTFSANAQQSYKWIMAGCSFISFAILFCGGFGFSYSERGSVTITIVSVLFLILNIICNVVFSFYYKQAPYIIVSGLITLLFIGITYSMYKSLNK